MVDHKIAVEQDPSVIGEVRWNTRPLTPYSATTPVETMETMVHLVSAALDPACLPALYRLSPSPASQSCLYPLYFSSLLLPLPRTTLRFFAFALNNKASNLISFLITSFPES